MIIPMVVSGLVFMVLSVIDNLVKGAVGPSSTEHESNIWFW